MKFYYLTVRALDKDNTKFVDRWIVQDVSTDIKEVEKDFDYTSPHIVKGMLLLVRYNLLDGFKVERWYGCKQAYSFYNYSNGGDDFIYLMRHIWLSKLSGMLIDEIASLSLPF